MRNLKTAQNHQKRYDPTFLGFGWGWGTDKNERTKSALFPAVDECRVIEALLKDKAILMLSDAMLMRDVSKRYDCGFKRAYTIVRLARSKSPAM